MNPSSVKKKDSDPLGDLDPSFLKENSQLVNAYENIKWDNVNSLNALVGAIEQVVVKYKSPNDSIKIAIEKMYNELLGKYPLFFGYWKRFTAVEYQLFGLEKSINTLKKSVEAFPRSLDLWCDYLNVLCTNNADQTSMIRRNFQVAKELVGFQFLSHPFWDKYIEFETKNQAWSNIKSIYEDLICIPLHQYAKYGTAYKEFLRSKGTSQNEIQKIDLSIKKTQKAVTAIWPYESKIKQSFFTLSPVSTTELLNWDNYLEFLQSEESKEYYTREMIIAAFERCLIPCFYYEDFWVKYTNWLEKAAVLRTQQMIEIYERGTLTLPSNANKLRLQFLHYLKNLFRKNKNYIFPIFTHTIANYMELWPGENFLMTEYLAMLKRFEFSSNIDQPDKEILAKQTSYAKFLESAITTFLEGHIDKKTPLQNMMSDVNLAIVVVELIKATWLVLKNTMQTRKYFNYFSKNKLVRSSTTFWLTYYKFEKSNHNFTKLNKFINDLGSEIFLPTTIVNDILSDYQSFYMINSNITEYQGRFDMSDNGIDRSELDPILLSYMKINNPSWAPNVHAKSLDWYKRREFKENGHPGIVDEKPQISNNIMEREIKSFGNILPPLPTFRNLEKINQPLKYENRNDKDYLKIGKA